MKTFTNKSRIIITTLLVIFLTLYGKKASAQFVTIPDANFVSYLTAMFPSCMSGNQMDTTCAGITSATTLNLSNLSLASISGVQYFDNLTTLNCDLNSLTALPNLPQGLINLNCANNLLTSLPPLPITLVTLNCFSNQLTSLPALPNTLVELNVAGNINLTVLPTLPNSLNSLNITYNDMTSLPVLPPFLAQLFANDNLLTSLPALPNFLMNLQVSNNPGLVLPPTLPPNLGVLVCRNIGLTTLPTLPPLLGSLDCGQNSITTLPNISTIVNLAVDNNLLTCLPVLRDTMGFFFWAGNSISCMPNYPYTASFDVNPSSVPICDSASGCPFAETNITGKVYFDNNTDCNYQVTEDLLSLMPIQLFQGATLIAQSFNSGGYFAFNTNLGNYDVVIDTTGSPFDASCLYPGLDTAVTLTAVDSVAENLKFGLKCKPGYDLIAQSVHSNGIFFPGQNVSINTVAGDAALLYSSNACNSSGISGTVKITVTGPVTYASPTLGSLTPDTILGNYFVYNIADFSLLNVHNDLGLDFTTMVGAVVGDTVCVDVTLASSGIENTLANNHLHHCFTVVNSYDPNVKEVSPVGDLAYPFNDWLTYTVHFQNTGTASAINIKIIDVLDSDLDASTFRLLNSSHPVNVTLHGQNVDFRFNDIMLSDSTTNEPASHGYVQYKIKPVGTPVMGTVINNTADIYFDFNSPITTNTTVNTITTTSGIENSTLLNVRVYPNPASEVITIQFDQASTNRYVQFIDMMGRVVQQQQITDANNMLSLASMANGVYSIKIIENSKETIKKIVVHK